MGTTLYLVGWFSVSLEITGYGRTKRQQVQLLALPLSSVLYSTVTGVVIIIRGTSFPDMLLLLSRIQKSEIQRIVATSSSTDQ